MGGVLGGLLEGVNYVGEVVLRCLIGEVSRKQNATARWARLLVGSIPWGALVAVVTVIIFEVAGWPDSLASNRTEMRVFIGVTGPLSVALLASGLELLRERIEKDETDS